MPARKQLTRIIKGVLRQFDANANKKTMRSLGAEAVRLLVARSRKGYGVSRMGENQSKFPPLSKAYIKQRRRRRLSRFTTPGKSNVTLTGKMLASVRTFQDKQGKVSIGPSGRRSDGPGNAKIAEYLAEGGREFMNLSASEITKLRVYYERKLLKIK